LSLAGVAPATLPRSTAAGASPAGGSTAAVGDAFGEAFLQSIGIAPMPAEGTAGSPIEPAPLGIDASMFAGEERGIDFLSLPLASFEATMARPGEADGADAANAADADAADRAIAPLFVDVPLPAPAIDQPQEGALLGTGTTSQTETQSDAAVIAQPIVPANANADIAPFLTAQPTTPALSTTPEPLANRAQGQELESDPQTPGAPPTPARVEASPSQMGPDVASALRSAGDEREMAPARGRGRVGRQPIDRAAVDISAVSRGAALRRAEPTGVSATSETATNQRDAQSAFTSALATAQALRGVDAAAARQRRSGGDFPAPPAPAASRGDVPVAGLRPDTVIRQAVQDLSSDLLHVSMTRSAPTSSTPAPSVTLPAMPMAVDSVVRHAATEPGAITAPAAPVRPASTDGMPAAAGQQIVQALRLHTLRGGGEAHIRLDPAYLGDVTIAIRVDQQHVTVRLDADTATVREWLQSHQHVLRQALADHQLALERLDIRESASSESSRERDERPADRQPREQRKPRQPSDSATFELDV
jgi:hypothetical protein